MSSPEQDQYCDRLKSLRKRIGKSQTEMAALLNLALKTYQRYEQGERAIPPAMIDIAAERIGLNPQWLYEGRGEMLTPGPGAERERIWNRVMGPSAATEVSSFSVEERKIMEGLIREMLHRFQARNINPPPAAFAKLILMLYDLVMERDERDIKAAIDEFEPMIK